MTAMGRPARHVWRLSALRAALWVLIAAGPLVGGAVWIRLDVVSQQLAHVVGQAADGPTGPTSDVEGVAELALADLLETPKDGEASPTVVRTVSLGAEELEPGYYAVTVGAARAGDAEAQVSFYVLGVISTSSGWAVTGPPALVAGPRHTDAPQVGTEMSDLQPGAGLTAAAEGFLSALLTGDGDLARYTSPGSSLVAVSPPPFSAIEVTEEASTSLEPHSQLVAVDVEGARPAGHVEALEYWLLMDERDGRWEVAEMLPAPPLNTTTGKEEQ
jgi:hypothetical protein